MKKNMDRWKKWTAMALAGALIVGAGFSMTGVRAEADNPYAISHISINSGPNFSSSSDGKTTDVDPVSRVSSDVVSSSAASKSESASGITSETGSGSTDSLPSDGEIVLTVNMYRLYNPNSGEHFYTANLQEKNHLVKLGWRDEGIGWYAPMYETDGIPVYRLYNKNGGEHHYTVSIYERRNLILLGWKDEGIGWYSYETYDQGTDDTKASQAKRVPKTKAVPLYRQYNPNAFANNHNYTTSIAENNYLVRLGWRAEGIGWYGVTWGTRRTEESSESKSSRAESTNSTESKASSESNNSSESKSTSVSNKKPPLMKVESSQNHPSDYYVDDTADKIGFESRFSDGEQTIAISVNGNLSDYWLEDKSGTGYFDGYAYLYATDINTSDGYKNLILATEGDDGIVRFYIFAYRGNQVSLLDHTEIYEETAREYLESGNAVSGDGRVYLMDSLRFYADPDGQPCFRSYVTVDGTSLTSHEDEEEVYHRPAGLTANYLPGCRLLLSGDVDYDGTDGSASGTFRAGSMLNVLDDRWDNENDREQLKVSGNGVTGWMNLYENEGNLTNFRGFA